jgi:hypothetical protein
MLEYAIGFTALALPSSAARLALDIRFFGRNGIDGGGAVSIGVIASVCGFIIQVLLIVVISLSGLASLDLGGSGTNSTASTGGSSSSDGSPLLLLTAALVVVGVVVTLAVPKYRTAVRHAVPRYWAMLGSQASSARTALHALAATALLPLNGPLAGSFRGRCYIWTVHGIYKPRPPVRERSGCRPGRRP